MINEECDHTYSNGVCAIKTVWFREKAKDGIERTVRDYEYCDLCGKRFCVSD